MSCLEVSMRSVVAIGCALSSLVPSLGSAQSVGVREAALARIQLAQSVAKDAEILKAIRAKNASGETQADIARKDKEWMQNPQSGLRKTLSGNDCARRLRDLTAGDASVVEVILMDKNGANVCVSKETSDYWQGDEPKFQKTFGAGKQVFVDEPKFDESAAVYGIQLSILVSDGQAKAGALTLGLKVKKQDLQK
jgi:hypothetical protein